MEEFIQHHPVLFAVGFAVYFVVLWAAVSCIVSLTGGWWGLAQRYRTERPFPAHKRRMQNGQMRLAVGYHNVLTLASDAEGIYLGVVFLFRLGHPRLFLPWTGVEIEAPKRWLFSNVQTLRLGPDRIPLRLRVTLVDFLRASKTSNQG
jgi:hypothetical protein